MLELADRLAARTLELVDIRSESRHEAEIAAHVAALVPPAFTAVYATPDASLFAAPRRAGRPLVVLAGHLDTVPAQGNLPGRIEDGWVVGLGASDMKGGLAVAVELARDLPPAELAVDLALLVFAREELPPSESPLPALFAHAPLVHDAALVILLEPTDTTIQAGCLGNLTARLTFHGRSGHSARPWLADNAIERALDGLRPFAGVQRREVVVGGLPFYEVLSLTRIAGGIADNVVPDRVAAHVNFRFAPDRSPESAVDYLRSLVPDGAECELLGVAPAGRVVSDTPLVRRLREVSGFPLAPKQAWTNVADFTARAIDAVNLGPGATRYAHHRDERVAIAELVRTYEGLRAFLAGSV